MGRSSGLIACVCVLGLLVGCGEKGETPAPTTEPTPQPTPSATAPTTPAKPGFPNPAVIGKAAAAPAIDGDLSDACWKAAEVKGIWVDVYTGTPAKPQPKAYLCYDDTNVYVGFLNPETKMKDLVCEATERDGAVWTDDSNELFIDPSAGKKDYCQFIVNTKGVIYDGRGRDGDWDSKVTVAVKKTDDGWSLEMAIPLKDLGVVGSPKGQTWTANFCRNRQTEGEAQAHGWADTSESFHNPEAFGKLVFK